MLAFPISIDTFKKSFLEGAGNVEIGKDDSVLGSACS